MTLKTVCIFFVAVCVLHALPSEIKRCKIDDSTCMVNTANQILQKSSQSIADIGMKSFEPLKIDRVDINHDGNAALKVDLKFRRVDFIGLSKAKVYKISGFKKDPEGCKLDVRFKVPLATLTGPYKIKGELFVLSLFGNGTATLKWENLDVHLKFLLRKVVKNGNVYAQIEKTKFTYETTSASINFSNLYDGDKRMGENMNQFLTSNWRMLLTELDRPIRDSFAETFSGYINSVFDKFPYDEMFAQ